MKILKDILYKVSIEAVKGATDIAINKIAFDSRSIELNDVFVQDWDCDTLLYAKTLQVNIAKLALLKKEGVSFPPWKLKSRLFTFSKILKNCFCFSH